MDPSSLLKNTSQAFPLWDDEPIDGAFALIPSSTDPDDAVVKSVTRPWLFGYSPTTPSNGRAILIFGGGGYIELMVGHEGVQVARWLASLGFAAFVLVHRFPNAEFRPQAPIDDARQALRLIKKNAVCEEGIGICALSSGGHLGAALLSSYPENCTEQRDDKDVPMIDFAIIGYAPILTNAVGRQIIANKPALAPPEKQELYNAVQPDVQLRSPAPPTFIVYAGNDPVVPVVNTYRLAESIAKAGGAVELHVFADAPHGFALDTKGLPVSEWPKMCEKWLGQGGVFGLSGGAVKDRLTEGQKLSVFGAVHIVRIVRDEGPVAALLTVYCWHSARIPRN